MILSSQSIRLHCLPPHFMLNPFSERTLHESSGMTFGLGPCTYDVRLAQDLILSARSFALASTLERFQMPNNVCATVMDKSTLARRGIALQNTHIDPGWSGFLTLEISNHAFRSILKLTKGSPIAQIKFEFLDAPTDQLYSGKYQNQPNKPIGAL